MPNTTPPRETAATATRLSAPATRPSDAPLRRTGSALTVAPVVPQALLKQHHCFIATDTRHTASSRLLSSLWRTDMGLPAGVHISRFRDGHTRRSRAGWCLRPDAARAGHAFLSPAIARFVRRALVLREAHSLWDETKICGHLLSSQGMCLNVLASMALDLDLATSVWRCLMPDFVLQVVSIRFESSPARYSYYYLNDGTAFDAVIDVINLDGQPGSIAVEWKNVEQFQGAVPGPNPRYNSAAHAAGLYVDPGAPALYQAGLEQLRREHTVLQLMIDGGVATRGRLVLIGPRLNLRVAAAAQAYTAHLIDPAGLAAQRVGFQHIEAETILAALTAVGAGEHAQALHRRYFDLDRVAALALGDDFSCPPAAPTPLLRWPPPNSPDVAPGEFDGATPEGGTASSARLRHADFGQHPVSSQLQQAAQRTGRLTTPRRSRRRRSSRQPGTEVR